VSVQPPSAGAASPFAATEIVPSSPTTNGPAISPRGSMRPARRRKWIGIAGATLAGLSAIAAVFALKRGSPDSPRADSGTVAPSASTPAALLVSPGYADYRAGVQAWHDAALGTATAK